MRFGQSGAHGPIVDALRQHADVVETSTIDQAINALRSEHFSAVFSDAGDFLPLERALVSQQANLILNTIGEGVCIVDGEGRCNWMNKKMQAWPARVHEKIRRTCQSAFDLFSKQISPQIGEPLKPCLSEKPSAPEASSWIHSTSAGPRMLPCDHTPLRSWPFG